MPSDHDLPPANAPLINPSRLLPPGPTSLGVVLGLTFVNSIGSGAVTNGVFFISKHSLGFGRDANFLLGIALGLTYIIGAMGVGPALRRLAERTKAVSHRGVMGAITIALGLLCFLPWLVIRTDIHGQITGGWALWAFVLLYSPITGALWPIVESYLSGGRHGNNLRNATGRFNICWALAIPIAYWGLAPLLENHALIALNLLGVLHLLSIFLVRFLPETPAQHDPDHAEPHPPVYTSLLALCRVLLPTSYAIFSVWSPYQPTAIAALAVPIIWQMPLAATWHVSRVVIFIVLERWHGWHGTWGLPIGGGLAMLAGFVAAVLAPLLGAGSQELGITIMVIALISFGGGMGAVYAASLYYAMAVGKAEVDAGGTHEALIGVGYTAGPALGFGVAGLTTASWFPLESAFEPVLIGSVLLISLGVMIWGGIWVRRNKATSR